MTHEFSTIDLQLAIAGNLPLDREQRLYRHLEQCEACSTAIEEIAGTTPWCNEAAVLLVSDDLDQSVPSREEWSDVDFTVEHLEPSDEPNVLGRLGGYDVLEIVGRGGMGVVLKAFDRELKRCVAIKVLAPHLARSSLAKKRFAREAQAAAAVVHPNVLAIHQVQPSGRLPFLVMPLVAGESLAQRLTAQGRLELKEILRIGMQAAAGLAAAHEQGLVHRDVKPANILLEKGVERAVITDFGLARAADDISMTRWGVIAGTPQYMSPEQARGEPLDGRSDLFSLGCVLYEMATGVSPFRADSTMATLRRLIDDPPQAMASLNAELSPWFVAIVERLLEKNPARRYGSAKEVSDLLERCLAHLQQPTSVPLPAELVNLALRPVTKPRKSLFRGVAIMLSLLGIGLLAAAAVSTNPPDIAGSWSGEDWGKVELTKVNAAEYTGTFSDTVGKQPGEIQLKWSRIERRFNGTWREGNDRFGDLSLRLVGDEIRGALTTGADSKINPATPRLADLTWKRSGDWKLAAVMDIAQNPGGAWTAKTPLGLTLEMVSVGGEGKWWQPDGVPLRKAPYDYLTASASKENGKIVREIAVRIKNLPSEPIGFEWKFDPPCDWSAGGTNIPDLRASVVRLPVATRTLTVRCGVAAGPWETVDEGEGGRFSNTAFGDDRSVEVAFAQPVAKDGGISISIAHTMTGNDVRLVAIGKDGHQHLAVETSSGGAGKMSQITANFAKIKVDDIRAFRFQARPYHWVEFRNVSLQQGAATKGAAGGAAALNFGPEIVRVVSPYEVIDLDTGKVTRNVLPDDGPITITDNIEKDTAAWNAKLRKRGVDAIYVAGGQLCGLDLKLRLIPGGDITTPEQLAAVLNFDVNVPAPESVIRLGIPAPGVFAFQTREGGMGLLINEGPVGDNSGVKIIYKLVQGAPRGASPALNLNPAPNPPTSSDRESSDRSELEGQKLVEVSRAPLELVEASIYADGGTLMVVFKDAKARILELCLDREEPIVPPNRLYDRLFVGAASPRKPNAILTASGGKTEKMVLSLLKGWVKEHVADDKAKELLARDSVVGLSESEVKHLRVIQVMDSLAKRNSNARLQFRLVTDEKDANAEKLKRKVGVGEVRVSRDVLLDETSVSSASVLELGPGRCISVKFTEAGGKKLKEVSGALVGKQLGIVFDGKLMAEPTITAAITDGSVLISGNFSVGEAEALAKAMTEASQPPTPATPAPESNVNAAAPDSRLHPVSELFINNHQFGDDNGCASAFPPSGQSTCGHPGHVSEVTWKFLRKDIGGDVYEFTRKYPSDVPAAKTYTKEVTYAGKALTIWKDDTQKIILRPKP